MLKLLPSVLTSLTIIAVGLIVVWTATDGGEAWTAESARKVSIIHNPIKLPSIQIDASTSDVELLTEFEKPILVFNFIYTNCPTVCNALGAQFNALQNQIIGEGLEGKVQLLSITFDNQHDDLGQLRSYLDRFEAGHGWDAIRIEDEQELQQLLNTLGVIVIPDKTVGFIHNAAFYIAHKGLVVNILDLEEQQLLLDSIKMIAQS